MLKIDTHAHIPAGHPDALALLEEFDVKLLNICVASGEEAWRQSRELYRPLAEQNPRRFAWCTTFDLPGFDEPDWADRVIAELDADLAAGAVACKVWKNIGMELRDGDGRFVQVDHPVFRPVFDHLEKVGCPVILHLGEPLACWQPLEKDTPHQGYYAHHPEWHMYGKEGVASHADIMAARDHLLELYPRLTAIGAHLGSLEYDVGEIARRLESYPNFRVDTSARLGDLARQDTDTVRECIVRYAERFLFGTDIVIRQDLADAPPERRAASLGYMRATYTEFARFFETDGPVSVHDRPARGLGLPTDVLERLYHRNAQDCMPGL